MGNPEGDTTMNYAPRGRTTPACPRVTLEDVAMGALPREAAHAPVSSGRHISPKDEVGCDMDFQNLETARKTMIPSKLGMLRQRVSMTITRARSRGARQRVDHKGARE